MSTSSPSTSSSSSPRSVDSTAQLLSSSNNSTVTPANDLNAVVEDLLAQMQTRFSQVGGSIMGRMDEMGQRMDSLEESIGALMDQAGLQQQPSKKNPASAAEI